jgi:hypothetical protein
MSTFSVLVFDPVLPVNATRDDLIDRLKLPDSLLSSEISPESFVALLKAWTIATSTSGPTDATSTDSPGDGSTPLQAARTTQLSASSTATRAVDSEAAGTGTLFLERLRQEESHFHSLGEFPIGGFLYLLTLSSSLSSRSSTRGRSLLPPRD